MDSNTVINKNRSLNFNHFRSDFYRVKVFKNLTFFERRFSRPSMKMKSIDLLILFIIGLEETCHVLKDNETGDIFMAVLGMVDITRGTNSYYKIQLLEDDSDKQWFLFRA